MNTWDINLNLTKGDVGETRQTYHWRDLGHHGQQEPNHTLPEAKKYQWIERTTTGKNQHHLSPENLGQANYAHTVTVQANQTNEHDEK